MPPERRFYPGFIAILVPVPLPVPVPVPVSFPGAGGPEQVAYPGFLATTSICPANGFHGERR
jgi:hypothetical protein